MIMTNVREEHNIKEMIDERKQTNTPPATTGTTVSSCSNICQILGRPGTGS